MSLGIKSKTNINGGIPNCYWAKTGGRSLSLQDYLVTIDALLVVAIDQNGNEPRNHRIGLMS